MGENRQHGAKYFPAKRLSIFFDQYWTQFKSADFFFPLTINFPTFLASQSFY